VRGLIQLVPEPWRTRYEQEIHEALALSDKTFRDAFDLIVWGVRLRMEKRVGLSLIVGLLLVLPFAVMEWSTSTGAPRSDFHVAWFVAMWFSAALFLQVLMSMVHAMRAGTFAIANPVWFALKLALLAVIAWSWVGLVVDQWPCFLGATGC
jgi:hypothetical protein